MCIIFQNVQQLVKLLSLFTKCLSHNLIGQIMDKVKHLSHKESKQAPVFFASA